MAAGEGTRLRPLTERWPKPVLPIDGRPVLAVLLRELAAADLRRVWVVTGYLADQVEGLAGDGSAFGVEVTFVHQPDALGSADAVRRALDGGAGVPALVSAADTAYSRGDIGRFAAEFAGSGAAGPAVAERLCLDNPPYELEHAYQSAIGAGETVIAVEIGKTRDLTYPLDLVEENFPYLRRT